MAVDDNNNSTGSETGVDQFSCAGRGETECRLMAAAFQLFREQGIHSATTRKIAEQAGVNEVTLFRHFGSKDGLLQAIMETQLSDKQRLIGEIKNWQGDPAEELRFLATLMWTMIRERREWMQIVMRNVHLYPQLAVIIDRFRQPFYEAIVRYFERQMKAGKVRDTDPYLAATMLVGPLMSMSMAFDVPNAKLVPGGVTPDEVFAFHIESFLTYLIEDYHPQPLICRKGKQA